MKTIDNFYFADSQNNTHSPKSKTYNENEQSWKDKQDTQIQSGTPDNNWNANDPVERSIHHHYDDEQRDAADYINSDHSDYNRGNSRYGWYEPEE